MDVMRRVPALATLLLLGCGGAPAVDVGTGADRFLPLHDGDVVPIIHGPQGGYHVWGAAHATNVEKLDVRLRFSISLDGGDSTPVTVRTDTVDLTGPDAKGGDVAGTAVFLPDPTVVQGKPCWLILDLVDRLGQKASARHLTTPDFVP
jgi:hypothetical protein